VTHAGGALTGSQSYAEGDYSMHAHTTKRSHEHGITLIELVVSITVGAIFIASIIGLFIAIGSSQRNVWYLDVATRTARSEIENARAKGVNLLTEGNTDITNNLPSALPQDATGVMNVGSVFAGRSRLVTVTITWSGGAKNVTLTGVVGRKGLIP